MQVFKITLFVTILAAYFNDLPIFNFIISTLLILTIGSMFIENFIIEDVSNTDEELVAVVIYDGDTIVSDDISIDGLKFLTLKYLQDNNLFGKPYLVDYNYNGTVARTIIFH